MEYISVSISEKVMCDRVYMSELVVNNSYAGAGLYNSIPAPATDTGNEIYVTSQSSRSLNETRPREGWPVFLDVVFPNEKGTPTNRFEIPQGARFNGVAAAAQSLTFPTTYVVRNKPLVTRLQ
ncbi:hypothetical protein AAG570_006959 [Ranatra chinensis]|uniref:Uncharacterized protein n=1 Tax=Ranatra chinensis TaxID=642074 RepID=A0ABD0YVK5_9HEMI